MSQPAARQGDPTAHGGTIAAGDPTVLINGMPAARQGDMHVCPMCNPGPTPHVGGPIAQGSPTVTINGQPAARLGDVCTCNGPPDSIVMGEPTVLIGSGGNPVMIGGSGMVMIGGSGPVIIGGGTSSGGGGGAGRAGVQGAVQNAVAMESSSPEATERIQHWLEFACEDAAGNPIGGVPYELEDSDGNVSEAWLQGNGVVRRSRLSEEEGTIRMKSVHSARWGQDRVAPGQAVAIEAEAKGFEDGTPVTIQIQESRLHGAAPIVGEVETEVSGQAVEAEWAYPVPEQTAVQAASGRPGTGSEASGDGSSGTVECWATVRVEGHPTAPQTGLLLVVDRLEGKVTDLEDKPRTNDTYRLTRQGPVREGAPDRSGQFKEREVAPGGHWCD